MKKPIDFQLIWKPHIYVPIPLLFNVVLGTWYTMEMVSQHSEERMNYCLISGGERIDS